MVSLFSLLGAQNFMHITGRYSNSKFGFLVPGKFAWMTQESPAFIIPIFLLWTTSAICWNSFPNRLLLAGFIVHYIQRYINLNFLILEFVVITFF